MIARLPRLTIAAASAMALLSLLACEAASATTPAKAPRLALRITVGVTDVRAHSLSVVLGLRSRPAARCTATVSAAKLRFPLPEVITNKAGRAALKWSVEAGAPRGKWKFRVRCAKGRALVIKIKHAQIKVAKGSTRPSLVAPGSIEAVAGKLTTPPPAQGPGAAGASGNVSPGQGPASGGGLPGMGGLGAGNGNPFAGYEGYCTWGAWEKAQWLGRAVTGNAQDWAAQAERAGLSVGTAPAMDAVYVRLSPGVGHVAVVTKVINSTTVETVEMNGGSGGTAGNGYKTNEFGVHKYGRVKYTGSNVRFIYKPGTGPGNPGPGPGGGSGPGGTTTPPTGVSPADPATGTTPGINGTHFEYFVGNDGSLRVSHWTGSSWQTDNFSQGVLSGTSPSAYLGPNGTHYVYFVGNDGSLRVSHWTGSSWQTDNFSQGVLSGTSPSAYLGPNGTHYVYFVGNDGSLRVSHWTGSSWQTDNFSQGVLSGTSPSAYLGPNGTHYVYFVGNDGSLRVSHWTGSSWQTDNFSQGVLSGTSPSAYLGPNGTHYVYFVGNDGSLRVSHWTGSSWQTDNFSQGVLSGTSPSAYLGPNGTHYVYFVGNDGSLRVSHWTGSSWQTDNFSQGVLSGTSPSAYLGPNGTHYVYFVGNDGSLRVSHWTGSSWQTDNFSQGVLSGTSPSAYLG